MWCHQLIGTTVDGRVVVLTQSIQEPFQTIFLKYEKKFFNVIMSE